MSTKFIAVFGIFAISLVGSEWKKEGNFRNSNIKTFEISVARAGGSTCGPYIAPYTSAYNSYIAALENNLATAKSRIDQDVSDSVGEPLETRQGRVDAIGSAALNNFDAIIENFINQVTDIFPSVTINDVNYIFFTAPMSSFPFNCITDGYAAGAAYEDSYAELEGYFRNYQF